MQIGEVIRKYRKEKNLTQEELANRLGITAPAVNKWENGNSMPDIMLLAPLARLLDISLDMLLSFRETLTFDEINALVSEANNRFKDSTYEEVFQWGKKKLEEYPNCERLILWMAQIYYTHLCDLHSSDKATYEDAIKAYFEQVLNSHEEELRNSAADSLFNFHLRKEQYEKAEEYIKYLSPQNPEHKRKQAVIYSKTNRVNEAYKLYEESLLQSFQSVNLVFHSIFMLAMQEDDHQKAHFIVEKQKQLARLFEMGEYYEQSVGLDLAATEADVDTTIKIMEGLLSNLGSIDAFSKSSLYEHMTFRDISEEALADLRNKLMEGFRDEETFGYLKGEGRWEEIIKDR